MKKLFSDLDGFIRNHKYTQEEFSVLLGKTIIDIFAIDNYAVVIFTNDGYIYMLYHHQDCCESVYIEDICGDLEECKGLVVLSEEAINNSDNPRNGDSQTWSFYKLDTVKDNVVIRFCGESNGYYSETVSFLSFYYPEYMIKDKLLHF